jgi:hypothetical protein
MKKIRGKGPALYRDIKLIKVTQHSITLTLSQFY